jgi:hypothetical protein
MNIQAQSNYSTFIWPSFEDASIIVSVDKPTYFAGDSIFLTIRNTDNTATFKVIPVLSVEGLVFISNSVNTYYALIPQQVIPESYRVRIKVPDTLGHNFLYETNCFVNIDERQAVELVKAYVCMGPKTGGKDPQTAVALMREQIHELRVIFKRKKIQKDMGPQFVTITTTVQTREKITVQTFTRRILTFRSSGNLNMDHIKFSRYHRAFGVYAAILPEELEQVQLQFDSLPDWAIIKVNIQPDYTIKIGAYDRLNSVTYYYRVKGPAFEVAFVLGIPKVLYDSQASDTIVYGKISAMVHLYYLDATSGHRFPINFGAGIFGVNSPIDIGDARGGFAASIFLDVIELIRNLGYNFSIKVNAGLELAPFFSIKSKPRILLNAQVGFVI